MPSEPTEQDLEILAYVDGHLDESDARRLEERMRLSPELADRVRAYKAQDEALALAYDASLNEPVPHRLLATLEARAPDRSLTLMRAAVLVLVIAAAGLLGWFAGRSYQSEDVFANDFVERSYNEYVGTDAAPHLVSRGLPQAANATPDTIFLSLRTPDLSHLGYRLAEEQTVAGGSQAMVRLTYTTPDGESFSLFLHPRIEYAEQDIAVRTERNISIAYWAAGPLAAAVAARLSSNETREIAQEIRAVLVDPSVSKPAIYTTLPKKQRDLVSGLPAQDAQQPDSPLPGAIITPQVQNAIPN